GRTTSGRLQMSVMRAYWRHPPTELPVPEVRAMRLAGAPYNGLVSERNTSGSLWPKVMPN
ncbi:MAG: hypothetical protein WAQ52_14335, partial [Terriglobales bacterium]